MKTILYSSLLFGLVCLTPITALAEAPMLFNIQGRLTNPSGAPLAGTYSVLFRVWSDSTSGSPVFSETKSITTDVSGLFSTVLGSTVQFAINYLDDESLYLGIKVGDDPEMTPRMRLLSVPWAMRVHSLSDAWGGSLISSVTAPGFFSSGYSLFERQSSIALETRSQGATANQNYGLLGRAHNSTDLNVGVYGEARDANGSSNSAGIYGRGISTFGGAIWAGYFDGWVHVTGGFSAGSKSFQIDDPIDPANSVLTHACVESDEYKNVYDGVVTTDAAGNATVTLPDWFGALNEHFRYQLTVIGQFAQAIVATEIADSRFTILTDKPHVKVSWQVTGVRKDAFARAHPIEVRKAKPTGLKGTYLHPKEHGVSEALGVNQATYRSMNAQSDALQRHLHESVGAAATPIRTEE